MKNFGALLLLFSISGTQLFSQKMIPGYILTDKGDSLMGYISGQDIKNYRDSFLFQPATGDRIFYNIKDCKGFGSFKPAEKFERWTVTIDMSYFDKDLYLINADSTRTGVFFLKNIYSGSAVSLYYYKDMTNFKEHFFIRSGNSMEELIQKFREPTLIEALRPGRSPNYIIVYIFRDQLYKYFDWQNNQKLKSKVDFAEYFYPKLVSIVKEIDNEKSKSNQNH
jgi:hypothetical protein